MDDTILYLCSIWGLLGLVVLVFSLRANSIRISLISLMVLFISAMPIAVALREPTLLNNLASCFALLGAIFIFIVLERAYFERIAAEDMRRALKESRDFFKDFAESGSDRFWEIDSSYRFTRISNSEVREDLLEVAGGMIGKTRWELIGIDPERDKKWARHRKQLDSRLPFRNFYYSLLAQDGKMHHWKVGGNPVFDSKGEFQGYRGASSDVTYEFEAQAAAAEAQARLLDALENITEGFAYWDREDKLVLCNRRYREMCKGFDHILEKGVLFEDVFRAALKHASVMLEPGEDFETRVKKRLHQRRNLIAPSFIQRYGGDRWIKITESRTSDGGTVIVCTDVTELKRKDRELIQAMKMEAVGQLSGGLAHDFNNLLSVILGNLELLEAHVDSESMQAKLANRAIQGGRRAAAITRRLLTFSRKPALNPQATNLSKLVLDMEELLKSSLGKRVQLKITSEDHLWQVMLDNNAFETILLNLALNARDAMPDGGQLEIEVCNKLLADIVPAHREKLNQKDYILLRVKDNGVGMPKEVVDRCFDPFFTTKDANKGSGLGLSMVASFIRQSEGEVFVESLPAHGTEIFVYLPKPYIEFDVLEKSQEVETNPLAQGERILVVEDDIDVRELTLSMLRSLAYDALGVGDADTAMAVLEKDADIDLVLSDIMLQGSANGFELAAQIRTKYPTLPVLFMSGYSEGIDRKKYASVDDIALLSKPFTRRQLAQKIRDLILDSKQDDLKVANV